MVILIKYYLFGTYIMLLTITVVVILEVLK